MRFVWIFLVVFRVRCENTTLTTARPREDTYPAPTVTNNLRQTSDNSTILILDNNSPLVLNNSSKPTLKFRRAHAAEDDNDTAPLDLFRWKDIEGKERRNNRARPVDIWAWDLYCHLQAGKGNCKEDIKRYYYDAQMDTCSVFSYSGCGGNKNNFETILDCERRCKGANFMGVNEKKLPTVCYLQADSGLCLAFMTNYYYDVNTASCEEFTYGGCGGNLNRFETLADCEEHCNIRKKPKTTSKSPDENPDKTR